ncbi:MAG: 6,7-dimethyl-8-ribityllumazine synthase [Actinomycetota bacterium]
MRVFEGGEGPPESGRFAIVAGRFNGIVVNKLVEGAASGLAKHGVGENEVDLIWVPGAFEIPLVARELAAGGGYAAVICLGAVIRGETAHFEYVSAQAAGGIERAGMDTGVPVIFGVLTTETIEQAMDRAGGDHGNRGWDAALAAMDMARLMERLSKEGLR